MRYVILIQAEEQQEETVIKVDMEMEVLGWFFPSVQGLFDLLAMVMENWIAVRHSTNLMPRIIPVRQQIYSGPISTIGVQRKVV
jgi:hypothetical protein